MTVATDRICVALIGPPKCGRYLTWRILSILMEEAGLTRSFMADSGIVDEIPEHIRTAPYHFPDSERMTGIDWQASKRGGKQLSLWWPDPDQPHRFDVDLERAVLESDLVSGPVMRSYLEGDDRMAGISHRVSIIRNGLDMAASWAHFAMRPETKRRWRTARRSHSPLHALQRQGTYLAGLWKECARQWRKDQGRDDTLCLRYEDITTDKAKACEQLIQHIGLDLGTDSIDRVLRETSPEAMRNYSPRHVRKATTGDWRNLFTEDLWKAWCASGMGMMQALGYKYEWSQLTNSA